MSISDSALSFRNGPHKYRLTDDREGRRTWRNGLGWEIRHSDAEQRYVRERAPSPRLAVRPPRAGWRIHRDGAHILGGVSYVRSGLPRCAEGAGMSYATLETSARQLEMFRADGRTLDHERDDQRLGAQMAAVLNLMADGAWRGLREVSDGTGAPEASCSARLRDVNKAKNRWMGWSMESQYVARGLWLYRLVPAGAER